MNQSIYAKLNDFISEGMNYWGVPGATVSIINSENSIYKETFGYRDVDNKIEIDENTVFQIGSITKSFTATIAAVLVDEGVLNWDTPIKEYVQQFKMSDACATETASISDFLSHRSGLPPHNRFWHGTYFTRNQLFEKLEGLEMAWPIRTHFEYTNLNFMVAACVMEKVTGKSWEELIVEKLFIPLEMKSASLKKAGLLSAGNYAKPYKNGVDGFETFEPLNIDAMAPAGAINMNMNDLMKWTSFQLNKGTYKGKQIISQHNMKRIHTLHSVNADIFPIKFDEIPYTNYGLGMFIEPYRGIDVLYHGGNVDGVVSVSMILPQNGYGITIQANMHEANFFLLSTVYRVIDLLLGMEPIDWNERYMAAINDYVAYETENEIAKAEQFEKGKCLNTIPSHSLESYTGRFENKAYGVLEIEVRENKLVATYNNNTSILKYFQNGLIQLEHYHYDVFTGIVEGLGSSYRVFAEFESDVNGKIAELKLPLEPLVNDVVFKRCT
jgi:CubicO group peptidase (beta-lactamase class C family)